MIKSLVDAKSKEDVFDFLTQYCKENIELSQRQTMSEDSFEKPAWSEYQAYQLGLQKAFTKVSKLIPDREKKN